MISYPISFFAEAQSEQGIQNAWTLQSQNRQMNCAIPPEFEGPGGALSPEDLFAQALTNCFVATFKVYAEKSKLSFVSVQAKSELIVDVGDDKKPVMKALNLNVEIFGCQNKERTEFIANKAFESGFILNSVKTKVTLNLKIET